MHRALRQGCVHLQVSGGQVQGSDAYIHTDGHTDKHTNIQSRRHTDIQPCKHTCITLSALTLHCITARYITLQGITDTHGLRYISWISLHYTLHFMTMHYRYTWITVHDTTYTVASMCKVHDATGTKCWWNMDPLCGKYMYATRRQVCVRNVLSQA